MESLESIHNRHKGVINGITWPDFYDTHSYGEVYSDILAPYRETAKNILEIGLFGGQRLRVWEEYFSGKVYGIDVSETPVDGMADLRPMIKEKGHNIRIMDATNEGQVIDNFQGIKFDVIIEDAGHSIEQQMRIYEVFKPFLAKGSIYIIEDIQEFELYRFMFLGLNDEHTKVEIIDRRHIKNRYDDILILIRN